MKKPENTYLFEDDMDDFGFTSLEEGELIDPVAQSEIEDLKKRLEAIRKIYVPMLEKLAKDSDRPIIRWPNRGPILKRHLDKLISLTEPGFK